MATLLLLTANTAIPSYVPNLYYLELKTDALDATTFKDDSAVLNRLEQQKHKFKPAPIGAILRKGYEHWFYFSLDEKSAGISAQYIEIDFPNIDKVHVYVRYRSGYIAASVVGDDVPHIMWPLDTRLPTIPLVRKNDNPSAVYLRLAATGQPALLPITILDTDALSERMKRDYLWYGLLFGALGILVAFNLMLYLATRIKSYFAYVAYLGCFTTLQLSITGIGQQWLWPSISGFTTVFALALLAFVNASMTYFVCHFLDIPTLYPKLTSPLKALIIISLLPVIFLSFTDYIHVQQFQHILAISSMVILVCVSAYCYKRGSRPGLYLLIGYAALFAGALLTLVRVNGILDSGFLGKHLLEIGLLFEAIILSLGLADRINELQDEKRAVERIARLNQETFTQQLITAHDSEKKHFGAILHDDIGHRVLIIQQIVKSLINNHSNRLSLSQQKNTLDKLDASTSQLMQEIHFLAKSSHPHLLEQLGLESAINSLLAQSLGSRNIDFSSHVSIGFRSDAIEQHLYRIAQECISNTLKHANATEVLLRIGHNSQSELFMIYKDDGNGFHVDQINRSTGFGLTSIAERVKLMGGTIDWSSEHKGQFKMHISNIFHDNQ